MTLREQIFLKDETIWSQDKAVQLLIANRLGWLDATDFSRQNISLLNSLQQRVVAAGFKKIVLLGMGGSSLAAEVLRDLLPKDIDKTASFELCILDGTCPDQIQAVQLELKLIETLFIVASKSGSTIETRLLFDFFYHLVKQRVGDEKVGAHFVAITDKDSTLENIANEKRFFDCFINPSNIGGRYSALSFFGLIPAVLLGWHVEKLLDSADKAIYADKHTDGLGIQLGEWLAKDYRKPIDILHFRIEDDRLNTLFLWIEQLVAESLGKQGEGMLLVDSSHRNLVQSDNAKTIEIGFGQENKAYFEQSYATISIVDEYELAAQFFHWEFATAYVAAKIGINPFDEPNVSEAKQKTSELLEQTGKNTLPTPKLSFSAMLEKINDSQCQYLGLLIYANPDSSNIQQAKHIQKRLTDKINVPITINFGPRYLHSVGQLHKGGKQHGAFWVIVQHPKFEIDIPEQDFGFSELFLAQALGDFQILSSKGLLAEIYAVEELTDITI